MSNQIEVEDAKLPWSEDWDLSTIPDEVFYSENGRRSNAKRVIKSGGILWSKHVAKYSRCRCARCMEKRVEKEMNAPPKRPRGRPRIKPLVINKVKRQRGRPRKEAV